MLISDRDISLSVNDVPAQSCIDLLPYLDEKLETFAVCDACGRPSIPELAMQLGPLSGRSLYRGSAERDYWAISPYLFSITPQTLSWLDENLTGEPWGYFIQSTVDFEKTSRHLRRFLTVLSPNGEKLLFRFYDPRVILDFLKVSTSTERQEFFGPVRSLFLPDTNHYRQLSLSEP